MPNTCKSCQPIKKGMYVRQGKRTQGPESFPLQLRVTLNRRECDRYSIKQETKRIHLEVKNVARKVGMDIKFYARRFIHLVSCLSSDNDTCYNNVES